MAHCTPLQSTRLQSTRLHKIWWSWVTVELPILLLDRTNNVTITACSVHRVKEFYAPFAMLKPSRSQFQPIQVFTVLESFSKSLTTSSSSSASSGQRGESSIFLWTSSRPHYFWSMRESTKLVLFHSLMAPFTQLSLLATMNWGYPCTLDSQAAFTMSLNPSF